MAPGTFRAASPAMSEETGNGEQSLRFRKVAELDQGGGVRRDDARTLQADEGDEQADACGNAELQSERDGVDQPCAKPREQISRNSAPKGRPGQARAANTAKPCTTVKAK